MPAAPFELPVKASEVAGIADIVFQVLENRRVQDDVRNRLATRSQAMNLTSIRPFWGSLQQDPVHSSSYYLAADTVSEAGGAPAPLLLRFALASAPASGLFPESMLVGRMRPGGGREVVVNAIHFAPADAAVETFATNVDRAFLPRPQGTAPAITVISADPERELPAAFDGFRVVQRSTGINAASIAAMAGLSSRTYAAAVWSAIRAGWRDGYNLEAEPIEVAAAGPNLDEAIRERAGYTRFRVDLSECDGFRPSTGDAAQALEDFGRRFTVGDNAFQFEAAEIAGMLARFGESLGLAVKLFDSVRRQRAAAGHGRVFDFEIVLPASANVRAAFFCQHWLRTRGRGANLVAPWFASVEEAREHAAVARHFGATLSFEASALDRVPHPSQWAGGRWNCRVTEGEITAERIQAVAAALRA